ncbi:hypothetical protein X730_29825 [Mesorhizobium sp. L103C565B0]|nr:hypothetical protein X730_29825 [Mesorhizobium sp. L103C565B0]
MSAFFPNEHSPKSLSGILPKVPVACQQALLRDKRMIAAPSPRLCAATSLRRLLLPQIAPLVFSSKVRF